MKVIKLILFCLALHACASSSVPETQVPIEACVQDSPMVVAYDECQAVRAYDQFHLSGQSPAGIR